MRVLGDEFHALFICPAFAQLRKKYLREFRYVNNVSVLLLHSLFKVTNADIRLKIAEFIRCIMLSFK